VKRKIIARHREFQSEQDMWTLHTAEISTKSAYLWTPSPKQPIGNNMSNVKDHLQTNVSTFKAPPRCPAGNYVVVIDSYEMLPFTRTTSGTSGLAYVPKIRAIFCLDADDVSNPDMQAEMQEALDKYGDWTSKEHEFAHTDKETQKRMAAVSVINFPLLETDAEHEDVIGIMEGYAWCFYLREADGTESGFVNEVLGLSFDEGTPLGDLLEATMGKKFIINSEYEPNQDNFMVASVIQA